MYIPLPESTSPSPSEIINHVGNEAIRIMGTVLPQTTHQYSDINLHSRSEKITSDKKRDASKMWLIIIPVIIIGVATLLSLTCASNHKKRTIEEEISESSSPQRSLSRSQTNDATSPRLYSSHKPSSGRPTGEMGAARAALGATINPPTPPPPPQQMEQEPPRHGRPTGQMGAARAALGATIEPGITGLGTQNVPIQWDQGCAITRPEGARMNNDRSLRFQESYLSTEYGTRDISRPTQEQESVYSLRPGENTVQMMQRVDEELHQAVSRYPVFANSVPGVPSPIERESIRETRETRETRPMTLDEQVSRQVASFPIFQQNSRNQPAIATGNNEGEHRETTTNTTRNYDELWREVATLPMFENTPTYRSMPTRRPDPTTAGFVTPPPAYEHVPEYGEDDGIGARDGYGSGSGSQGANVSYEGNVGLAPSVLPPAYVRYERRG
ncbi:44690698-25f5-48a2-9989-7953fa274353-CDS [Sclerotinia trifoliorum]|uniref:44690698-25f5-48a2-9989-7953fa274353-CDS n=1 Tax=Sclerotinia trifoliorum TaxID=28548 RepID=A0A8H2VX78_9HELO|nr:44690698-25f5-48a2-9989-7953fa274353-CDS [Sclerotinia trifoliorum]